MNCRTGRGSARAVVAFACLTIAAGLKAATITVNSLADDTFPNAAGAIFTSADLPIPLPLPSPHCTLRMAIAAANLNVQVGGANGCASGSGPDVIVFDPALNLAVTPGTITLFSKAMSEAPAAYSPANTAALAISGPLTITGPGSTQLTLDGALTALDGRRMLVASDGNQDTDNQVTITGLRFYAGRVLDNSAGCMFSSDSTTLNDVTFENCESVGGPNQNGYGGALGFGNQIAGTVRPTISISNSKFIGNRATRGSGTGRSENGALFIGSGTRKVGAVTLTNVLFTGNSAERNGALLITDGDSVVISGSQFVGNTATGSVASNATNAVSSGRYGAFFMNLISGNVTINNATRVHANVANEERGGFGIQSIGGSVTIDNVDVTGNFVNRGRVGGFEVLTDTFDANGNCLGAQLRPVTITNTRITGNSVATNAAGFRVTCSGALTMTDTLISRNEARGYRLTPTDTVSSGASAGQIVSATDATAAQSTATLTRVQIRENNTRLTAGGGGFNVLIVSGLGAFTADSIRFHANTADNGNGFTMNARGAGRNYLVVNSEFTRNTGFNTPAMFIETDGNYTLRNSTVSENSTTGGGGIISINGNTNTASGINVAIEHSTIARNQAGSAEAVFGDAFANQPNAGVTMNTLFGANNASLAFRNTILGTRAAGYTGTNTLGIGAANGFTNVTATNTLLEWTGGAPVNFCAGIGVKCNVGSLVSPATNNGNGNPAITLRTMALMAGSPAIDAGGAVTGGLTTDERGTGFPRVVGTAVDMGAYESTPATTVGCTLDADGNKITDALTDGLLLIRALFGLTGTSVTNNAVGAGASRTTWAQLQSYLNANCGTGFAQ